MQINRLFQIVYLLLNKKNITAEELAVRFEVSKRTIYRDIDTLSIAGIPIYTAKGKGGGIRLMDKFILNKSLLTEQEQQHIITALQGLSATNPNNSDHVLSKLSALFGDNQSNWISIDYSDWSNTKQDLFELIKQSILSKKILQFDYYNSCGEISSRSVEPFQLWFKNRCWYLKAYCLLKQDIRLFKLTRMKNTNQNGKCFKTRTYLPELFHNTPASSSPYVKLTVLIDACEAYRIYDDFLEHEIEKQKDGSYLVKTYYVEDEWIYSFLLSYGNHIKIISPVKIKEHLLEKINQMRKNYL